MKNIIIKILNDFSAWLLKFANQEETKIMKRIQSLLEETNGDNK